MSDPGATQPIPANHPPRLPSAPGWPIHPAMVAVLADLPGFRVARSIASVHASVVRPVGPGQQGMTMGAGTSDGAANAARREALLRMLTAAAGMGANAVIGLRFDSMPFLNGVAEICAYGTAVWAEVAR